jgi:ribonuclease HI
VFETCGRSASESFSNHSAAPTAHRHAAELLGILYSLTTAVTASGVTRATLFVDNQAAIRSIQNPQGQSGQLILRQTIHFLNILHRRRVLVEICWIPVHTGVPGNEKADIIAKQAAGRRSKGRSGPMASQSKWVWQLLSSCKRTIKEKVQQQWREAWRIQKTGEPYRAHFGREIKRRLASYTRGSQSQKPRC